MSPTLIRLVRLGFPLVIGVIFFSGSVGLAAAPARPEPPFKWRVIEPWMDPSGKELFTHDGNIMTWDNMLHLSPETPLGQYVAQIKAWGFNLLALHSCDLEANPAAIQAFCHYLKPLGIGVVIRREWREPETGNSYPGSQGDASPRASALLNPYNPEVKAYWEKRLARDYQLAPDLAGHRIWGTEFYFANGGPWMGEGPGLTDKTPRECVRDAIRLIADLERTHGAVFFWEACQDDPWGQRQERHYFHDLQGEIPANAFVVIKDYYWDFHPRWPRHPLNYVFKADGSARIPYLTSVQVPGEYMGVNDIPWSDVDHLSEVARRIAANGQDGIWVMAQPTPAPPWDHPLNAVNWSALGELLHQPQADPTALRSAWAQTNYGDAGPAVLAVIDDVTEAARGMFEFDALWTGNHSRFPTLVYLDSHLCGPYRQVTRMKGMMGLALPLDMYPPDVAHQIRSDPLTRMVFNQYPITPQLKAEAMAQKDAAVARMRSAIARWEKLAGKIEAGRHAEILAGLRGNLNDTIIFQHMMDIYMDWKLGTLTEARIDAALAACQGLVGRVVPDPLDPAPAKVTSVMPASLKTFAEEIRRDLQEPWVEDYWRHNLKGAGVVDPLTWGKKKAR